MKIKIAKQDLKERVANPNNAGLSVQTLFQNMTSDLMRTEGMRYEYLQQICRPYEQNRTTFQKIRSILVPREVVEYKKSFYI